MVDARHFLLILARSAMGLATRPVSVPAKEVQQVETVRPGNPLNFFVNIIPHSLMFYAGFEAHSHIYVTVYIWCKTYS